MCTCTAVIIWNFRIVVCKQFSLCRYLIYPLMQLYIFSEWTSWFTNEVFIKGMVPSDREQGYLNVFKEKLKNYLEIFKKSSSIRNKWILISFLHPLIFLKKLSWAYVREKYDVAGAIKKYFLVKNMSEVYWRINIFNILS